MPGRWVPVRRLDQRLVVPDADAVDAGERRRYFAQIRIHDEPRHLRVCVGKAHALRENFGVVLVRVALIGPAIHSLEALAHGIVHRVAPVLQFGLIQEVLDGKEAVLPVRVNLRGCDLCLHGEKANEPDRTSK